MMSSSANIRTTPKLFDLHVRKFRSICDMHGVRFGSHKDLRGFIHALTENQHLSMDFWAFIGTLNARGGGQLSVDLMLAVIVEGIAGDDIPDAPDAVEELKSIANQLAYLLAGVDVQSPLRKWVDPIPFPRPELESQTGASEVPAHDPVELPLRGSSSRVVFISEPANREAARPASSLPAMSSSHPRATFIPEGADGETAPASSLPSTLSSSHLRATFVSEVDGQAAPAPSLPSTFSSSRLRAAFVPEMMGDQAAPAPSSPSTLSSSHLRATFIPEVVDGEAAPSSSLPSTLSSSPPVVPDAEAAHVEAAPSTLLSRHPAVPDAEAVVDEAAPASAHPMSMELQEALGLLQLSNLELKQQLYEINEKMSRLEAHPGDLTSKAASSKATKPEPAKKTAAPPVEQSALKRAAKSRPFAWTEAASAPERLPSAYVGKWTEPPTPVVMRPYADHRGPRDILRYIAILLVLVVGAVLIQQYGTPLQDWFSPLRHRMQGAIADQLRVNSPKQSPATEPPVSAAPAGADVLRFFRSPPASRDTTPRPPITADSRSPSEQTAPTAPRESQPDSQGSIASRAESALTAVVRGAFRGDSSGPVSVPAAVMQNNLIRSRAPVYPAAARAGHVAGPVVATAIISKSGAVEDVNVIEGDPLLRRAAVDAISKWRYRPYLLNGHPVKAATTITVDVAPKR
jgi:TonB family protein